jgi:hypothetical protein
VWRIVGFCLKTNNAPQIGSQRGSTKLGPFSYSERVTLKPWGVCLSERSRKVTQGLSPHTLADYCKTGRSTLVRGVDFGVRRPNAYRRQLFFTERGIARLIARDYKVPFPSTPEPAKHKRDPMTYSASERRAMLRHNIARAFILYLQHPCAVPGCPCVIHSMLRVPQADYVHAMLELRPSAYPKGGSYSPKTGSSIPSADPSGGLGRSARGGDRTRWAGYLRIPTL